MLRRVLGVLWCVLECRRLMNQTMLDGILPHLPDHPWDLSFLKGQGGGDGVHDMGHLRTRTLLNSSTHIPGPSDRGTHIFLGFFFVLFF